MRQYLKHPLVIILIVSTVGACVALTIAALTGNSAAVNFLTNFIVFLATALLSYVITHFNERDQFAKELAKFSDFSKRRVQLLSENLASLEEEIADITNVDEVKRLVSYTLTNMAQDAAASVEDIREIGGGEKGNTAVPRDDVTYPPVLQALSHDENKTSVETLDTQEPTIEQELTYSCTTCGHSNSAKLGVQAGTTKQVMCSQCDATLNLHRLGDGGFRVVSKNPRRLSYYSLAAQQKGFRPPSEIGGHLSFTCPRCMNNIPYNRDLTKPRIEKPCFGCLSVVSFDQSTGSVAIERDRTPLYVSSIHTPSMVCQHCGSQFAPRIYRTGPDREFTCCFKCNTIYLEHKNRKIIVQKQCATPGCGNRLNFSTRDSENESRQFCFECKTRQKYERDKDLVSVIETLSIPTVSISNVTATGVECPHCGQNANGRATRNKRGQRLSVCWNCKNVFEIVSDSEPNVAHFPPRT